MKMQILESNKLNSTIRESKTFQSLLQKRKYFV